VGTLSTRVAVRLRGRGNGQRAVRGVPWVLLAYAAQRGDTLLTLPVLARILTPEDFGVVALASLAIALLTLFRDFGLGGALVLRSDNNRRAEGTMLAIVATSSIVIALIVVAAAPLVADLFRSPRLEGVLRVLSISIFLAGIAGFYESLLQRDLAFRERFAAVMSSALAYGLCQLASRQWEPVSGAS